jgi:hypothetical protein
MAENENTTCFTYKVEMIIQILAGDETTARLQLDDKGGYVTSRTTNLVDAISLYNGDPKE